MITHIDGFNSNFRLKTSIIIIIVMIMLFYVIRRYNCVLDYICLYRLDYDCVINGNRIARKSIQTIECSIDLKLEHMMKILLGRTLDDSSTMYSNVSEIAKKVCIIMTLKVADCPDRTSSCERPAGIVG